jgi:ribose transport system substrate-binding protein
MKKIVSIVIAVFLIVCLLCGCTNAPAPEADDTTNESAGNVEGEATAEGDDAYTIGCVLILNSIAHCQSFADGFTEYVESQGGVPVVLDSEADTQTMLDCIDSLISQGVDGIVVECMDDQAPLSIIKEATEAGIPVAAADLYLDTTEEEGIVISQTVTDNYGLGAMLGEDLIKRSNGEEMNVLTLEVQQNSSGVFRIDGFCDTIAGADNLNLLERVSLASGTQEETLQKMDDLLLVYDDIDAIFCMEDTIAMVCLNSLKANNRLVKEDGSQVMIYGVNGDQEALEAIKAGEFTADAKQQPDEMARLAAADVYEYLRTGSISHEWSVEIPAVLIDSSNVDDYLE